MKKTSLTILCDLDGIVADFVQGLLDRVLVDTGTLQQKAAVKSYDVATAFPWLSSQKVYSYFREPDFFENLSPIPGAVETLKKLHEAGHDIIIVTAPSGADSAAAKMRWVRRHLPFIHEKNILIGWRKELVSGDVFIDDCLDNAKRYRERHPDALIATIAWNYNDDRQEQVLTYNCRAEGFERPEAAWDEIGRTILWHAVRKAS